MTQPRARALHKSGQNGKSGSGDTIGIRVPSEDALRKIAFNVVSVSGERSKKSAQREGSKIREYERKEREPANERAERQSAMMRSGGRRRERGKGWANETGSVGTFLIENLSVLAILIKSRKSLTRSIGQTGKTLSAGSCFVNARSRCAHFTQLFPHFYTRSLSAISIHESFIADRTRVNHFMNENKLVASIIFCSR